MISSSPAHDCWFLTGPTAAGKTSVGIQLARRLDAEIISLDSMALYRGMDVGTAKPSADQLKAVRHHLIDVIQPQQEYSLAQYLAAAGECIEGIKARGHSVLFVGGTPLYLKALLRGIFEGPPADWTLRRSLEEQARARSDGFLHRRLAEIDPVSAAKLHPHDWRRLIRAIEVFEKTGRPISELQTQFHAEQSAESYRVFVLDWPREELYERIDRRVEQMFAAGLVEEVRGLLRLAEPLSRTASQALGYRETIKHLRGERPLPETVQQVKIHTRQFAKRQGTWFRSLPECRFVPMSLEESPAEVARRMESV